MRTSQLKNRLGGTIIGAVSQSFQVWMKGSRWPQVSLQGGTAVSEVSLHLHLLLSHPRALHEVNPEVCRRHSFETLIHKVVHAALAASAEKLRSTLGYTHANASCL